MPHHLVGDGEFRLLEPRLAALATEKRFREISLASDARRARVLLLITVVFQLTSIASDYGFLGPSPEFRIVLWIRIAGALASLITLLLIHLNRSVNFFDTSMLAWAAFLGANVVLANGFLPAEYTGHVAWDILLALGTYTVIPISFPRQILISGLLSGGNLLLFAFHKVYAYPSTLLDVTLAFLCANLVGAFASWEMHRWRRELFLAFEGEKEAKERFEIAQAEIQTLRGIISICASCKKIRTDEGSWRQVEAYVRDHSEAEFSHSICPECSKAIYGDDD